MANLLTAVTPRLLAQGLLALRQQAIMAQLVNRQYQTLAGQKGSSIDVPIPSAIAAQAVAPANVPPSTADIAPNFVSIQLNQWIEAPFYLTDNDMLVALDGVIPMQASEAIKSLANNVDAFILALYKGVYGFYGTPGTTPFTAANQTQPTEAAQIRAILNKQLAPLDDRRIVVDPICEAAAINLRAFTSALDSGSTDAVLRGHLGTKLGLDWYMDQNVPTQTAGTLTGTVTANGAQAIGGGGAGVATADNGRTCTVSIATAAASSFAPTAGDIITFAGDTQTYAVISGAGLGASVNGQFVISPALKVAKAGGEVVTLKASHVVNLAFHRDAFAFATRPLESGMANQLGSIVQSAVDPVSGLTLRLEITREHKRNRFSYDILYGAQLIRPELAARLAG